MPQGPDHQEARSLRLRPGRPPNEVIRDLRKALMAPGAPASTVKELIATVHGVGYRLGLAPDAISFADEGATHKRHTIHT